MKMKQMMARWSGLCALVMVVAMAAVCVSPVVQTATAAVPIKGHVVARKLIALYSTKDSASYRNSLIHTFLEMPANHLGFDFEYVDIDQPLPKLGRDVRGVVVWLSAGREAAHVEEVIDWLEAAMDSGKKIAIIENIGVSESFRASKVKMERLNKFLFKLGMKDLGTWSSLTYASEVIFENKEMVGFERSLPKALPPYLGTLAMPDRATSHMRVRTHVDPEYVSDLVITSPKGGYIAEGYAIFEGYPLISMKDREKVKKIAAHGDEKTEVKSEQKISAVRPKNSVSPTVQKKSAGETAPSYAMKAMPLAVGDNAMGKIIEIPAKTQAKAPVRKPLTVHDEDDSPVDPMVQQWYVNPFLFLADVFDAAGEPKPDVTTLNGKRIFYSHIDGDGWNNISEIEKYKRKRSLSAEVVMNEVLKEYSDIPVSVSVIAGEMDVSCYGRKESADIARQIFALPNVEPASHTYSHPLEWEYFEDNDVAKEIPLLGMYPEKTAAKRGLYSTIMGKGSPEDGWAEYFAAHPEDLAKKTVKADFDSEFYDTPRSFACEPYSVEREIIDAAKIVDGLAPAGKKMRLVQWSGDTSPYEEVLRTTREAGYLNINGGDSRYDFEYPSYTSVSPIGIAVGQEHQIYSSNSNENTYTHLWTDRFFGFRYLKATAENTERPKRVQPFNIYFHMYSGQKQASLMALKENFDFARTQDIIPLMAADFVAVANGFYSTHIVKLGENRWRITDRGALGTVRFDHATNLAVDMDASLGVLGYRYFQGSLYVSLNPDAQMSDVVLKPVTTIGYYEKSSNPYLIDSRWLIKQLTIVKKSLKFTASGYGRGVMHWHMPSNGNYHVKVLHKSKIILSKSVHTDNDGLLKIDLENGYNQPFNIEISEEIANPLEGVKD